MQRLANRCWTLHVVWVDDYTKRRCFKGFTLAELLIALAILGIIATFVIPKIISSQQSGKKQAIFKETIGALSEATYLACINPPDPSMTIYAYYASKLNTLKQCPTNAQAEGCDIIDTEPGFLLHNGASVAGVRDVLGSSDGIVIDYNGLAGPNLGGDDRLAIVVNYSSTSAWNVGRCKAGASPDDVSDYAYYQQILSQ
jgi:prepilin-type N-terminal cleavage/methylation domain-containing protein